MTRKNPPTFRRDGNYKEWKARIKVWVDVCGVEVTDRASLVMLEIEDRKALKAALRLTEEKRRSPKGVEELLKLLDLAFDNEDPIGELVEAYRDFLNVRRMEKESISEFVYRYGDITEKLEKSEVQLPESLLSYMLLQGCDLDAVTERIVRTNCRELTMVEVQLNIKKATDSVGRITEKRSVPDITIKHEPMETMLVDRKSSCQLCGLEGHLAEQCRMYLTDRGEKQYDETELVPFVRQQAGNSNDQSDAGMVCYNCGFMGHRERHCPSSNIRLSSNSCLKCGLVGHRAYQCTGY